MWHVSERGKHAREKKFASLASMRQKRARAIILRNYRNLTISLMKHHLCFEVLNVWSVNLKACFRLFQDGLRWGEERNKQQQQRRGWLSLLLSLLFPRLPVIRVLFPSGPQCFPLDQPVSAYNYYFIFSQYLTFPCLDMEQHLHCYPSHQQCQNGPSVSPPQIPSITNYYYTFIIRLQTNKLLMCGKVNSSHTIWCF